MLEQTFKRIISGNATGFLPACARSALWLMSGPYRFAMWFRNRRFDRGRKHAVQVSVPVIAVGNLTTGGTGKTPIVAWIVHQLQQAGSKPGIVSRGYGADQTGTNDEKRVLEILCPDVPHIQNPDRVAAANELIRKHAVDVIVCDDAFQHRRISRDLDVVLIDATNPFGYGYLLPRGLLREPVSSISRADIVVITRSNQVTPDHLTSIRNHILATAPHLNDRLLTTSFEPTSFIDSQAVRHPLSLVTDKRVMVMTGIGNPEAFVTTCRNLQTQVESSRFFPDHHHYSENELSEVRAEAESAEVAFVLTTLKDLVKVPSSFNNMLAVNIETVFARETESSTFITMMQATRQRIAENPPAAEKRD